MSKFKIFDGVVSKEQQCKIRKYISSACWVIDADSGSTLLGIEQA